MNPPEPRICVNREVGLGSHSLSHTSHVPNKPYGFCGRKAPSQAKMGLAPRAQELCEQEGGPGLSFPIPYFPTPELINHAIFVDVKTPRKKTELGSCVKREVGLGSRVFNSYPGPFLPLPNKPYGFCGRKVP